MNKKYRTRDGREVRVLCVDRNDEDYPVVALINRISGETPEAYTGDGFYHRSKKERGEDLIELSPYYYIKKGDVVLAWDSLPSQKRILFFIGYDDGKVISTNSANLEDKDFYSYWKNCELYTGNK